MVVVKHNMHWHTIPQMMFFTDLRPNGLQLVFLFLKTCIPQMKQIRDLCVRRIQSSSEKFSLVVFTLKQQMTPYDSSTRNGVMSLTAWS